MQREDETHAKPSQNLHEPGPRCYVVNILLQRDGQGSVGCSPALAEPVRAVILEQGRGWRNKKIVPGLRYVIKDQRLPGLAVQYYSRKKAVPDIPPPATVTFEPIPLDETHPSLEYLAASGEKQENAAGLKRARVAKRILVRYGIPLVLVIQLFANALPQALVHGLNRWTSWLFVGSLLLALLCILAYNWYRQNHFEWILVPGGVVVRKSRLLASGSSIELLTPANSILLIRPAQAGWSAQLHPHKSTRPYTTPVTELERSALLATWQSSVQTPEPEKLRELI